MISHAADTNFYKSDANEIYTENFDFTILESPVPIPNTAKKTLRLAIARKLATAVFAFTAGILTIPSGGTLPFGISIADSLNNQSAQALHSHSPDILAMTRIMRERAELAARVFQRTPHPGDDDVEPDYGF